MVLAKFFHSQLFVTPAALPASVDLTNQTAIVTGSNTGLGFHAAKQLLERNLTNLILAVRSESKGNTARNELLKDHPNAKVSVWVLDLDSYDSIKAFAERTKTLERIDIAILNAGVVKTQFEINPNTGNEETIQVNWLSTGLLALLLLPVLEASKAPQPHLTIVGSEVAEWAKVPQRVESNVLAEMNSEKKYKYEGSERYWASKFLLWAFFREFIVRTTGTRVIINEVNPGYCASTGLQREVKGIQGVIIAIISSLIGRKTEYGARTLVNAAVVQGKESHGCYLGDNLVKMPFLTYYETPEGKRLQKQLWSEATTEFSKVIDLPKYA